MERESESGLKSGLSWRSQACRKIYCLDCHDHHDYDDHHDHNYDYGLSSL